LILQGLKLSSVRNLAPVQLEPGPHFNVLSGNNGQGKTNLLESIYVIGTLRSFRTQRLADLIKFGESEAYLGARVQRGGLERKYELTLGERSRKVRLDGKTVRPISKYFGDFNVVLFAPEDLGVPRGSPSDRRRFIDRAVFNWRKSHLVDSQAYEKVVRNRNALLKDMQDNPRAGDELLEVYDLQLSELGARLVAARREYLADVEPRFVGAFEAITHSSWAVGLRYATTDDVAAAGTDQGALCSALLAAHRASRARDRARGTTSSGPHRDDLVFELEGRAASSFASQGQLRAVVLAWKTAEMDLLAAAHGDPPVLLLDDVSSELDSLRNEYLFEFLRSRDNQCFITTTHPKHVLVSRDRLDFEVSNGLFLLRN
jgi:DNA replication and repair protein RecF